MEQQKTDTPAILGGEPAVTLPQTEANRWPILTEEDEKAVVEVMRSGNITTHPVARDLEEDYAAFVGRKFALSHNNGTSALMAAFFAELYSIRGYSSDGCRCCRAESRLADVGCSGG